MERPWIAGWELTTNEKGVEMATLPAQMLRDTLDYLERLEKQCNIADVVATEGEFCECGTPDDERAEVEFHVCCLECHKTIKQN